MNKTIGTFRTILTRLYQEQDRTWSPRSSRKKVPKEAQSVWDELSQYWWPPIEERELEKLLKHPDQLDLEFEKHKVLYLPPLKKGGVFVPAMSMNCVINDDVEDIKIRVMLVRRDGESNQLQGIGFRLESPEGEGEDRHDFYHAQLIAGFRKEKDIKSISWLPDSQPSFPILARCPITMILSLLITLYGKNYCLEFYNNYSLHRANIKSYMNQLNEWVNWPDFT